MSSRVFVSPTRQPFVALAAGAFLGVILEDFLHLSPETWIAVVFTLAAVAVFHLHQSRMVGLVLVSLACGMGGLRLATIHSIEPDDISHVVKDGRKLCRLRGIVFAEPFRDPASEPSPLRPMKEPSSRFRLQATAILNADNEWFPTSGGIAVYTPGLMEHIHRGDTLEIIGWLSKPNSAANPGSFDAGLYWQRKGIRAVLSVETPTSIALIQPLSNWQFARFMDSVSASARKRLEQHIPTSTAGLAEAVILGSRTLLRSDELEPYVNTGTLHMLIVSGWHIGIIAWATVGLGRTLLLPTRLRALFALSTVWGYTMLTGGEAPAVRAAILATMMLAGQVLARRIQPINSLAAAGFAIVAWDPTQIFQPGTQLSFLAVMGLMIFGQLPFSEPPDDPDEPRSRKVLRSILQTTAISVAAWATTAPLVASEFHLFSPASIWLSVLLAPLLVAAIIVSAFVFVFPDFLASIFGGLAGLLLGVFREAVRLSESIPFAFAFLPGPPKWWTIGACLLTFAPWIIRRWKPLSGLHVTAVVCWSLVGMFSWSFATLPVEPQFHQLSVGHGNAAVLQTGDGRTILIDCGSMNNPDVGIRTIAPFLWHHGIGRLDAVVISHADTDHFNGLPGLLARLPIKEILITPQFNKPDQPGVAFVMKEIERRGMPTRFLSQGDRIDSGNVSITALWPPADASGLSDNSDSLVLEIRSQGRKILSTADLAEAGLARVLEGDPNPVDVIVVPHHGSRTSNPIALVDWANAKVAINSQSPRSGDMTAIYRDAGAVSFRTDEDGCVSCFWSGKNLWVEGFKSRRQVLLAK